MTIQKSRQEAQEQHLFGGRIWRERGVRFDVEGVEIGVSGFSTEQLLVTY